MKSLLSIFLSWVVLLVVYLKLLGKPKVTYVIFLRFYVFVCLFVCFWHVKGPRLQARGQIPAATASLQHSHSTPRSETRLQPTPQLTAKTYEKYKVIIWVLLCFVSPFLFLLICEYPAVPASFVEDKIFSPFYPLAPLSKVTWLYTYGSVSGLFILLLWPTCLFFHRHHTVWWLRV